MISLVCLIILLLGCVLEQQESREEKIDRIAMGNAQMQEYVIGQGYSRQVNELSVEEVIALKQQSMFKDLPEKALVQVEYSHPQKGKFIAIIDLEDENVLKFYRIAGITIG